MIGNELHILEKSSYASTLAAKNGTRTTRIKIATKTLLKKRQNKIFFLSAAESLNSTGYFTKLHLLFCL